MRRKSLMPSEMHASANASAFLRQLRRSKLQDEARSFFARAGCVLFFAETQASKNPIVAPQTRTRDFDELHRLRCGRNACSKPVGVIALHPRDECQYGTRRIGRIARGASWIGTARLQSSHRCIVAKKRRGGAALWVDGNGGSPPLERLIRQGRRQLSGEVVHHLIAPHDCRRDRQRKYKVAPPRRRG